MDINRDLKNNKAGLLVYFRSRANEILSELALQYSAADYKMKASALNKAIIQSRDNLLEILNDTAREEHWRRVRLLGCVLDCGGGTKAGGIRRCVRRRRFMVCHEL